jgi:hypothetical protein
MKSLSMLMELRHEKPSPFLAPECKPYLHNTPQIPKKQSIKRQPANRRPVCQEMKRN